MQSIHTGIIYDVLMLEHRSRRKHPERPQRIRSIIDLLQKNYLLNHPVVEYLKSVDRYANEQQLLLAHTQKYIRYIVNLWPKNSHRTDMTVLDTYFNKNSEKVARLAVGALLTAIDKLITKQWNNGFAIVRPPGHHSGAHNTINGFCIYNQIAISAKYLLSKHKLKRVAIVDWDVHHGDGTQFITQQNQNILLISIHRYDRGTFYPSGQQGHYTNCGKGKAMGSKINIPLNFVDQKFKQYTFQAPGDNQYVYIFNRIVEPILKKFDPDFILVSSGFDASQDDPLGGFTVTPYGYYYMTNKLLKINKPILMALEGGYNLDMISQSTSAVIKALVGEFMPPNDSTLNQRKLHNLCSIDSVIHQQIDHAIQFHSTYWPILNNNNLNEYTQQIKANKYKVFGVIDVCVDSSSSQSSQPSDQKQQFNTNLLKQNSSKILKKKQLSYEKNQNSFKSSIPLQFYFAAGHLQRFRNFDLNNPKIQKLVYEKQIEFYESNFEEKVFAPAFYGKKQDSYIIIENLLYKQKQPTILDIKLSRQSKNPYNSEQRNQKQLKRQSNGISGKYALRISGYTTPTFKEGGLVNATEEVLKNVLQTIVNIDNKQQFCQFLSAMSSTMKSVKRKYFGTSIVIIKGKNKSIIKWIDFHYWVQHATQYDKDLVQGIDNMYKFINEINLQKL